MADSGIENIDKLLNKLDQLGSNSDEVLTKGLARAGKMVEGEAKSLCPVDSGRLRNSIKSITESEYSYKYGNSGDLSQHGKGRKMFEGYLSGGNDKTVVIGTNVEYAQYVEFGTGQKGENSPSPPKYEGELGYRSDWNGQPAQPFIYPALKNNEDKIKKQIANELKKEIRKLCK